MLQPEELDRVAIDLVRARNPNNIGAVARAMHDFGFRDLRLVNDYSVPLEAARSAIDASAVLSGAREFPTVAEAVADCTLVAGTTAVGERDIQHPLFALRDAAPKIFAQISASTRAQDQARVALLFGSEKTGLSNNELSHCHWLLTIPMRQSPDHRHPSMNLGQAVAVCLYELVRQNELSHVGRGVQSATAGERERLAALFEQVLQASEYTRHHPANSSSADLRRLLLRLQFERTDTPVWMGILRQILWKLRPPSSPDDPRGSGNSC